MYAWSDIPAEQQAVLRQVTVDPDPRELALMTTAAVALVDATEALSVALGALQASERPSTESAASVIETLGAATEATALYYSAAAGRIR